MYSGKQCHRNLTIKVSQFKPRLGITHSGVWYRIAIIRKPALTKAWLAVGWFRMKQLIQLTVRHQGILKGQFTRDVQGSAQYICPAAQFHVLDFWTLFSLQSFDPSPACWNFVLHMVMIWNHPWTNITQQPPKTCFDWEGRCAIECKWEQEQRHMEEPKLRFWYLDSREWGLQLVQSRPLKISEVQCLTHLKL